MNEKYIENNEVKRYKIAIDIKNRKLDRAGIEQLLSDPVIAAGLHGERYNEKRPKEDWNKYYLDELSYAAIAEYFNREYLFYLDEVADYVVKKCRKRGIMIAALKISIMAIIAIAFVALIGFVVHKYILE